MHYNINQDIIIKSENAAKSNLQPNKYVLDYFKGIYNMDLVLDYGCGKLRYTIPLCNLAEKVIAIDSEEQITRKQRIWAEQTSIIDYSDRINNLQVYSIRENKWKSYKYDFILCSNILSAIPYDSERFEVLNNIKELLNYKGRALITTQYRNSYFSTYESRNNTFKYHDGWIIKNKSYYSFYGLISTERLVGYCNKGGLSIEKIDIHDGSSFITVSRL